MNQEIKPIDKSKWGEGPWQSEPDRIEWEFKGYPCLMTRTPMGNWCGYVAVPPGHPFFEKGGDSLNLEVHGGITYADHCRGHICHVPKPGQSDNVWWLGFDCAHAFDGLPGMVAYLKNKDNFFSRGYKDVAYVRGEVERLAAQIAKRKRKPSKP